MATVPSSSNNMKPFLNDKMEIKNNGTDKENDTLRELVDKLNHPLVSVRSRALRSIKFKLTNQIVSLPQLIHERSLFIHLLEWFNFNEWAHEDTVLNLLRDLVNYEVASETLQEVGGVEFLSQLRCHLRSSCHEIIDEILEKLLQIPSSFNATPTDTPTTATINKTTPTITSTRTTPTITSTKTTPSLVDPITTHSSLLTTPTNSSSRTDSINNHSLPRKPLLPWIQLTEIDEHVLLHTLSRLQSHDTSCIEMTWKFFNEVLLVDFPPQVFLQRPSLIKLLFHHLSSTEALLPFNVLHSLALKLLLTLTDHTVTHHLNINNNITLDAVHTDTRRGEGGEKEVSSHLISHQLDIFTFISTSLSLLSSLLLQSFDKHLPWLNDGRHSDSCHGYSGNDNFAKIFRVILECMSSLLQLLIKLVEMCDQDENEKEIHQCIDVVCTAVSQCVSKLRRARGSGVVPHSLLSYLCPLVTILSNWFLQLVNSSSSLVRNKTPCITLLKDIYTDPLLTLLNINDNNILEEQEPGLYKVLQTEGSFFTSFKHLHYYLKLVSQAPPINHTHLIDTARSCLLALYFNWGWREKEFVKLTVLKCITILVDNDSTTGGDVIGKCQQLLVDMTANGMRLEVITETCQQLKNEAHGHLCKVLSPSFISQLCVSHLLSSSLSLSSVVSSLLTSFIHEMNWEKGNHFMKTLITVLPYMECSSVHNIDMFNLVCAVLDHTPPDIRTCSLLRMMYSPNKQVREKSFGILQSLYNLKGKSHLVLSPLSPPPSLRHLYEPSVSNSSRFKVDDINKLLSIITSHTIELALKGSAMEQLSTILYDSSLHEGAIKEGLLTIINDIIINPISTSGLLLSSVKCLLLLAQGSDHIRRTLASNGTILNALLKVHLSYDHDDILLLLVSQCIALVVFNDVMAHTREGLRINEQLLQLIQLPFAVTPTHPNDLPPTHSNKATSTHFNELPPTHSNYTNILNSPPTRHRLWLQYMISSVTTIHQFPHDNDPHKGPLLNDTIREEMSKEEKRALLFNMQCLLYIHPSVRLKWSLMRSNDELRVEVLEFINITCHLYTCLSSSSPLVRNTCTNTCTDTCTNSCISTCIGAKNGDMKLNEREGDMTLNDDNIKLLFQDYLSSSRCCKDTLLTADVFNCLTCLIKTCDSCNLIGRDRVEWAVELALAKDSNCIKLLKENRDRELTKAILVFLSSLPNINLQLKMTLYDIIVTSCDITMTSCDNHILYLTLYCLWRTTLHHHYSNKREQLSVELIDMYMKLIVPLRKVVWSSVSNRGSSLHSFINKGLTKLSVINIDLTLHLILNDDSININKEEWLGDWLSDSSLIWIQSLLHDNDTMISVTVYSILTSLLSFTSLYHKLVSLWSHCHSYGLLGAMIDTGLDISLPHWMRYQSLMVAVSVLYYNRGESDLLSEEREEKECGGIVTFIQNSQLAKSLVNSLQQFVSFYERNLATEPVKPVSNEEQVTSVHSSYNGGLIVCGLCQLVSAVMWSGINIDISGITELMQLINKLFIISHDVFQLDGHTHTTSVLWIELCTRVIALLHVINTSCTDRSCDLSCDYRKELSTSVTLCVQYLTVPSSLKGRCDILCYEVISYLRSLLSERGIILNAIIENWSLFTGLLMYSMKESNHQLTVNCLSLLSSLLSPPFHNVLNNDNYNTNGSNEMTLVLLEEYETGTVGGSAERRVLIWRVLLSLLAISDPAKDTVVQEGLMESLNDKILSLHTKLTMSSPTNGKKKVHCIDEMIKCLRLVQNIVHGSVKHKSTAVRTGLIGTLTVIWPLSVTSCQLIKPHLQLLVTLSANCTEVHTALINEVKPPVAGGICLYQQLLKTATLSFLFNQKNSLSEHSPPYSSVFIELFTVLSHCVLTQECRTIMKKTNFFSSFLLLNPKADIKRDSSVISEWLKLLVNVTFNGQSIFTKLNDIIDVLYDVWNHSKKRKSDQMNCLIILRNLSFYGPARPLLATHEGIIDIFSTCLKSDDHQLLILTCTAIGALIDNCSKLKVLLRNKSLHHLLSQAITKWKSKDHSTVPSELNIINKLLQ